MALPSAGRRRASSASAASRRSPLWQGQSCGLWRGGLRPASSSGPPHLPGSSRAAAVAGVIRQPRRMAVLGCSAGPMPRAAAAQSYRRGRRDSPRNLRTSASAGGGRSDRDPAAPARCCAGRGHCGAGAVPWAGRAAAGWAPAWPGGHCGAAAGARQGVRSGRILGSAGAGRGRSGAVPAGSAVGRVCPAPAGRLPIGAWRYRCAGPWGLRAQRPAGPACVAVGAFPSRAGCCACGALPLPAGRRRRRRCGAPFGVCAAFSIIHLNPVIRR